MPTTVIVETLTSARDINGNCYHFARFYNPAKGRQHSVCIEVGGQSNAEHLAYRLAGNDYEKTLAFSHTLPKREWQRNRANAKPITWEGSKEAKAALAELFGVEV